MRGALRLSSKPEAYGQTPFFSRARMLSDKPSFPLIFARFRMSGMKSILLLALLTTCVLVATARQRRTNDITRLAKQVTIYRDTYGVPHVFGRTDAATVFGFA